MTAKTMFKKLRFKRSTLDEEYDDGSEKLIEVWYTRGRSTNVLFDLVREKVYIEDHNKGITADDVKAISKQIEEFGWK